jgi:hypothetical protein
VVVGARAAQGGGWPLPSLPPCLDEHHRLPHVDGIPVFFYFSTGNGRRALLRYSILGCNVRREVGDAQRVRLLLHLRARLR